MSRVLGDNVEGHDTGVIVSVEALSKLSSRFNDSLISTGKYGNDVFAVPKVAISCSILGSKGVSEQQASIGA